MAFISRAAFAVAVLAGGPAFAQAQKVSPPKTVYWLSAATQSGFGMQGGAAPSGGDMMRMAMGGGGGGPLKLLDLDIGSKLPPSGPPTADHFIPPVMNMGASLPLRTPKRSTGTTTGTTEDFERPKGKVLLFWGCGETARPGQPVVIDFAKLAAGQVPPNLFGSERVRIARPPSQSGWPTYGRWPNDDRQNGSRSVPGNASLLGAHKVTGSYVPQIDFTLQQDWMQGIGLKQAKAASGALTLNWNAVPGATAHFAQMISGKDEGGAPTLVYWSSSEAQTFFSALSDYIAPGEATRLVGRKQLMPPSQTSCAVPKEAIAAAEGGLINLTSHGPEVNFIHPPRPTNPKQDWVQEWAVKARFASRTGAIVGMEDMGGGGGGGATASGKPKCPVNTGEAAGQTAGGAILGGGFGRSVGGAIGGLMGGKKKKPQDCEP